ncbi:LysR family transcriptional regulator [Acanthopleuribacter pedis]|uniref:LysR family transcriptional regulator n=1 Tax=Acanthopleuribacter pedis TaxID=442870 RepID=A0A8J7QF75_9BACT|nr:LysR family transcriptional regulator [Acanthopleuribacter pedis]MBO1318725.1 LysR family transcriptional regulator [Acanthopleuribacter pedis]
MDYNKLRTLLVVAEAGSVTAAARQLNLTQQAVSAQIAGLEQNLAMALLTRANRRVFLTDEGRILVAEAAKHLRAIDGVVDRMQTRRGSLEGLVRLGIFGEYAPTLLLPRLAAFQQQHPGVRFQLNLGPDATVEAWLRDNVIDMGFIVEFSQRKLFERRPFAKVPYRLYAAPALLAEAGTPPSVEAVLNRPLVDFAEDCPGFGIWLKRNEPRLVPRLRGKLPRLTVADDPSLKAAAVAGMGFAVLPEFMVKTELEAGQLVLALPGSEPITAVIDLTLKEKRTPTKTIETLADFLAPTQAAT